MIRTYSILQRQNGVVVKVGNKSMVFNGVTMAQMLEGNNAYSEGALIQEAYPFLTAEQRERILRMPTSNFRAFLNFCYGLDASDMGNIDLAQYYFGLALEIDPDFEMAKPYLFPISLFQAANIEDQQSMSRRVSQIVEPGSAVSADAIAERSDRFRVGLRERFQTMSQTMDVGFIPGNDTRKPYEEAISAGASVTLLPGPPAPPFIPDEWFLPGPPAPPNER